MIPLPVALVSTDKNLFDQVFRRAWDVSARTGVPPEAIMGRSRRHVVVVARAELMLDMWREGVSIAEIGKTLGYHHTSVMYCLRKALGRPAYDSESQRHYPSPWRALRLRTGVTP